MLKGNLRFVLYFDLLMSPHPSDAPAVPLADLIPPLRDRCENGECYQVIDNERRVIRLSELVEVSTPTGERAVGMLFCLGDRDKAIPGFTDFATGAVRIADLKKNEVGGLSVHAVASLRPTASGGHIYRFVYEDIPGLGKSLIQSFLRNQFKIICDDMGYQFERKGKKDPIKTRPLVDLIGHASDRLKNSLKMGRLLHVELTDYVENDLGFDESKYVKLAKRNFSFSVGRGLPEGEALSFVEKVKVWGKRNGYADMRVRWKEPNVAKPQSAKVNTDREDAGEALFIRSEEIELKVSIPEVSSNISAELVEKMTKLLE